MIVDLALGCIVLAAALAVYRVLRGPSWGDRVTALDFLSVDLAVLIVVLAMRTGIARFLDAALIFSILGFLSTVALTRYLLNGRVMR
ncbi:MAG: monovalent cation/H+ antiporter complex subunit F [Truepera sp.]|nr:monovalent cation/H+ antiporter complex subunit F [Truepera sp.]MDE0528073.1 monovalent cation/H+ antiporter complex subunit F [Truepera sp.]